MNVPEKLQSLIEWSLDKVRENPDHYLTLENRIEIYQEFGNHIIEEVFDENSNEWWLVLSPAACIFGWLAILTTRKVLPFWHQETFYNNIESQDYSYNPNEMLSLAEGVLLHKIDSDTLKSGINHKYYYGMIGLNKFMSTMAENIVYSAYASLEAVAYGLESVQRDTRDFSVFALEAYAIEADFIGVRESSPAIDPAFLEMELDEFFNSEKLTQSDDNRPENCPPEKCHEFWEWWLTEAIPEAVNAAQKNY